MKKKHLQKQDTLAKLQIFHHCLKRPDLPRNKKLQDSFDFLQHLVYITLDCQRTCCSKKGFHNIMLVQVLGSQVFSVNLRQSYFVKTVAASSVNCLSQQASQQCQANLLTPDSFTRYQQLAPRSLPLQYGTSTQLAVMFSPAVSKCQRNNVWDDIF